MVSSARTIMTWRLAATLDQLKEQFSASSVSSLSALQHLRQGYSTDSTSQARNKASLVLVWSLNSHSRAPFLGRPWPAASNRASNQTIVLLLIPVEKAFSFVVLHMDYWSWQPLVHGVESVQNLQRRSAAKISPSPRVLVGVVKLLIAKESAV